MLDAEPPVLAPAPEDAPALMHTPINVRSVSLAVLAVLASLYVLHWASAVFIPLLLGLTFSYALTPMVNRLVRLRLPRALAAALLLVGIVAGTGSIAWSLSDDATTMIQGLPEVAQKLRRGINSQRGQGPPSTMEQVQKAAAEIQGAAEDGASPAPTPVRWCRGRSRQLAAAVHARSESR